MADSALEAIDPLGVAIVVFYLFSIAYVLMTLWLWVGWKKIPVFEPPPEDILMGASLSMSEYSRGGDVLPCVSVIVPARNEADNIPALLADLAQQYVPPLEIILADDHSEDGTAKIAMQVAQEYGLVCRVISIGDVFGKKAAIRKAIEAAKGSVILTTDADCRLGPGWVAAHMFFHHQHSAALVSAPVLMEGGRSVFGNLQTVEFASLIGAGAATLHAARPTMCNGANLSYTKAAFIEVGGFAGNEHLLSGDDEFLMHKVFRKFPDKVFFMKSVSAIVRTAPQPTVKDFWEQRKRWAGKWGHYKNASATITALFVFLYHLCFLLALFGTVTLPGFLSHFLLLFSARIIAEFVFLATVLSFFGKKSKVGWIPITALLYSWYVVITALLAQNGSYIWKNRPNK